MKIIPGSNPTLLQKRNHASLMKSASDGEIPVFCRNWTGTKSPSFEKTSRNKTSIELP